MQSPTKKRKVRVLVRGRERECVRACVARAIVQLVFNTMKCILKNGFLFQLMVHVDIKYSTDAK
jgi:hypothetical protein